MKSFTNLFGTKIEKRPFFQECLNTWRVSRFENGELFTVYENKGFSTKEECLIECCK